jgi:hypothetical protein
VGKDGSSQDERIERAADPILMLMSWESSASGAIAGPRARHRVVHFSAGDSTGGPMSATNLTVTAPGALPSGLRDVLPGLLSRNLVRRATLARPQQRMPALSPDDDSDVVRVRTILSQFADGDVA